VTQNVRRIPGQVENVLCRILNIVLGKVDEMRRRWRDQREAKG
jgi:uncharacterized protein (DUF2342 family)